MAYFCSLRLGKLRVLFGCVDDENILDGKRLRSGHENSTFVYMKLQSSVMECHFKEPCIALF